MKLDPEIERLLKERGNVLRDQLKAQEIVFFGSRAEGTARPDSDIDMIIVSNAFEGTRPVNRMGNTLNILNYPRHIDIICLTPQELDERKKNPLFRELYESGIPHPL